jgi:hypothetical protein
MKLDPTVIRIHGAEQGECSEIIMQADKDQQIWGMQRRVSKESFPRRIPRMVSLI